MFPPPAFGAAPLRGLVKSARTAVFLLRVQSAIFFRLNSDMLAILGMDHLPGRSGPVVGDASSRSSKGGTSLQGLGGVHLLTRSGLTPQTFEGLPAGDERYPKDAAGLVGGGPGAAPRVLVAGLGDCCRSHPRLFSTTILHACTHLVTITTTISGRGPIRAYLLLTFMVELKGFKYFNDP